MRSRAPWHAACGSQPQENATGRASMASASLGEITRLVDAALNTVGLGCVVGSLLARRSGDRGTGIALSTIGLALASVSAWLGGEMVYRLGTAVSRDAWVPSVPDFVRVGRLDALPEGK